MYTLEAILDKRETLCDAVLGFSNVRLVQLPQEICMIPVVGALIQEPEIRYQGAAKVTHPERQQLSWSLFHPIIERLIVGIDQFAGGLSHHGLVAYLEATLTGGYGGQATMLWEWEERHGPPGDNLNAILKRLSVVYTPGLDEFDTLGLGRYRSTKEWFAEYQSRSSQHQ